MNVYEKDKNTIIEGLTDFDLEQTLECGQCFRFYKQADKDYVIVAYEHLLHIMQKDNKLIFLDTDITLVNTLWINYFDLNRDYRKIKDTLLNDDKTLEIAIKETKGVRILNQEFHETLISFIISQNKQIPHIKAIVKLLSEKYGTYLGTVNEEDYFSFPKIKDLFNITEEDFRMCKTGFRAPYLRDAVIKLNDGTIPLDNIKNMNYENAKDVLLGIKGVGEKVANCVLLFSLGHRSAFPIDVWIKRIMEQLYFNEEDTKKEVIALKAKELYKDLGGYAQQYLFYYGRSLKK